MLLSNIQRVSKRDRTKQRLQACALELFERYGFESTTVSAIATAADVTSMTFFRYFPSKESVVLDDPYDPVIGEAIARQPAALPPLIRVARGIREAWSALPEPESDVVRRRVRIAAATPGLRAAVAANSATTERLITEALVRTGVAILPAKAAASAAMAAMTAAMFEWSTQPDLRLGEAVACVVDVLEARDA
jgi:AcrR family transcriptional regulator